MEKTTYIRIQKCCDQYNIELSFIRQLQEFEIVQIESTDNDPMVPIEELPKIEKMIRLHRELDINPQGLHAIHHLLEKVTGLQEEVAILKRKLDRFKE
ncbi:chaperone modulator CbpM [Maribacter sp. 2210JD10-5]|uniref:chaperone modulator CbpM n=1 Tax=Maribacter sp. 2210JD10-5 TaxID=3386272 RepID=UPI0039BC7F52